MMDENLKSLLYILTALTTFSCSENNSVKEKKADRFYFLSNHSIDTFYIEKPTFDTIGLRIVAEKIFSDDRVPYEKSFHGKVFKLSNEPAPIDGGESIYLTPDLGVIYTNSTTWDNYSRLHSTNDSIEKRINLYLEHILFSSELLKAGEISIEFVPPVIKED